MAWDPGTSTLDFLVKFHQWRSTGCRVQRAAACAGGKRCTSNFFQTWCLQCLHEMNIWDFGIIWTQNGMNLVSACHNCDTPHAGEAWEHTAAHSHIATRKTKQIKFKKAANLYMLQHFHRPSFSRQVGCCFRVVNASSTPGYSRYLNDMGAGKGMPSANKLDHIGPYCDRQIAKNPKSLWELP